MAKARGTSQKDTKNKKGWGYYKTQPLKAILVHVPEGVYEALKKESMVELRSLEKTVRKVLMDYAEKSKG